MARKRIKHDYFATFHKQAELALEEANVLIEVMENFTTAEAVQEYMPRAHEIETRADELNHSNFNAIAVDFITPIDRDDVVKISQAIDEVVDEIEEVVRELYIMNVHAMHEDALKMAQIIKKACEALVVVTAEFKNFKKSDAFKRAVVDANSFEEEADELYAQLIRRLHVEDEDKPMLVLVWSRIFTKMEVCTDVCEHVADIMNSVLLKNS